MKKITNGIKKFLMDDEGLTTAEWVILASAIALLAMAIVTIFVPKIKGMANNAANKIEGFDPEINP